MQHIVFFIDVYKIECFNIIWRWTAYIDTSNIWIHWQLWLYLLINILIDIQYWYSYWYWWSNNINVLIDINIDILIDIGEVILKLKSIKQKIHNQIIVIHWCIYIYSFFLKTLIKKINNYLFLDHFPWNKFLDIPNANSIQ